MRLYDKAIECLSRVTNDLKELRSILQEKPDKDDKLTREEEQKLQIEMLRFTLAIKDITMIGGTNES